MTWVSNGRKDNVLMRLADQFLLAQIREKLLSHIPDDQWKLVEEEVDKAGGVREVEGYTGVLLKDAISKASFDGDRSAAGRYAANQRWQGQGKSGGGGEGKTTMQARAVVSGEPASPSREQQKEYNKFVKLNDRRRSLERDIEYTESNLNRVINEQLGRGAGQEAQMQQDQDVIDRQEKVLSNLKVKRDAIQAQIEKEFPTASPQSEPKDGGKKGFDEDDFADKKAFANRKDSETYKKTVENNIKQIERKDGVPRYKGSGTDLKSAKQELDNENEMLQAFENKTATVRRLLGGNFKRSDARAIIQARIASAEAKVQALEEFDDRTTPRFNAD
jgi:hypothetical protein